MYDLKKILIIGKWKPEDKSCLQTIVMKTDGLKVESILYLCDNNSTAGDKKSVKKELKKELYADQYDDDLAIKVKEVINGEHAIIEIAKFINKQWSDDILLYYYDSEDSTYIKLEKELMNTNSNIYLNDYHDIFVDRKNIDKDILTIMKEQGLKTENMIKDSQISFTYFLSALVEKMLSK